MSFIHKKFRYTFNYVVLFIFAINVIVYYLTRSNPWLEANLSLNPVLVIYNKAYWQFVTYMFVHSSFSHIFWNMFGLLMFGLTVERAIGSKEFLLMYILCGTLSGFLSFCLYWFTGQSYVFLLGASGAIYSILFAFSVIYPKADIYIWGIIPIRAPILILVYAVIEVVEQLFFTNNGVAHLTHLFGFGVAWLYFLIRMNINPIKRWKDTYL